VVVPRRAAVARSRLATYIAVAGLAGFGALFALVRRRMTAAFDAALTFQRSWPASLTRSSSAGRPSRCPDGVVSASPGSPAWVEWAAIRSSSGRTPPGIVSACRSGLPADVGAGLVGVGEWIHALTVLRHVASSCGIALTLGRVGCALVVAVAPTPCTTLASLAASTGAVLSRSIRRGRCGRANAAEGVRPTRKDRATTARQGRRG
jgi:hypothetical protein